MSGNRLRSLFALVAVLLAVPLTLQAAATIVIVNNDGPGEGFNNPTPAAPVGGNPGTTIGEQRLYAFQHAANIWGATLTSIPVIRVLASFDPLSCTASSAVLGSAGPTEVWRDFSGAPFASTWYHVALANKLFGGTLDPATPEISARFNSNLGQAGCLTGTFFYYGVDNNHGANLDLVTVLLHEFAHGLGFSTVTSGASGAFLAGFPSAWDHFTLDLTTSKMWVDMTNAERAASALNPRKVVWTGPNVTTFTPVVLTPGTPQLAVFAPGSIAGTYLVGTASFGPPLASPGVTGELMPVVDTGTAGLACNPLSPANVVAVNGKIALIDRGTCTFVVKVKNAQNAGAIGVLIADNVAGSPPAGIGGSDPTISIPSVRITLADGNILKAALRYRSRTHSGVIVNLGVNLAQRSGADLLGRMLLFTPNPYQDGSSVSHWDTIALPNLLMEPDINADLTHSVTVPQDLTRQLLLDIGW
jgi:hypothetical protein